MHSLILVFYVHPRWTVSSQFRTLIHLAEQIVCQAVSLTGPRLEWLLEHGLGWWFWGYCTSITKSVYQHDQPGQGARCSRPSANLGTPAKSDTCRNTAELSKISTEMTLLSKQRHRSPVGCRACPYLFPTIPTIITLLYKLIDVNYIILHYYTHRHIIQSGQLRRGPKPRLRAYISYITWHVIPNPTNKERNPTHLASRLPRGRALSSMPHRKFQTWAIVMILYYIIVYCILWCYIALLYIKLNYIIL